MTDATTIDDETLKAAIRACSPYRHLADLKQRVAKYLGQPELNVPSTGRGSFGYRVYTLSNEMEEAATRTRIAAMGFQPATDELLAELVNCKVEMLLGVNSIFGGESIETGTIKPNGRGGYFFLPKGSRTKGYHPTFLRPANTVVRQPEA